MKTKKKIEQKSGAAVRVERVVRLHPPKRLAALVEMLAENRERPASDGSAAIAACSRYMMTARGFAACMHELSQVPNGAWTTQEVVALVERHSTPCL